MSGPSNIAWTNETWNPVRGCERISPGCMKCYAEILAARHSYAGGWGEGLATWVIRPDGKKEARWTGDIRTVPDALNFPVKLKRPSRIFVNSMSDLFHKDVPVDFIAQVFAVMAGCEQHIFQILTKRADRMHELLNHGLNFEGPNWPLPNVWLGVSVERQEEANARIPLLLETPAAVRWISAEPLLGPVSLRQSYVDYLEGWGCEPEHHPSCDGDCTHCPVAVQVQTEHLDWVVVGGESGQERRPMAIEDARQIIQQCQSAGVPVFVKQDNGSRPGMQGRFTAEEWALKEYPS